MSELCKLFYSMHFVSVIISFFIPETVPALNPASLLTKWCSEYFSSLGTDSLLAVIASHIGGDFCTLRLEFYCSVIFFSTSRHFFNTPSNHMMLHTLGGELIWINRLVFFVCFWFIYHYIEHVIIFTLTVNPQHKYKSSVIMSVMGL